MPEEVDALPWWQRRMYVEMMNEEFRPPDEEAEYSTDRSYADVEPEPDFTSFETGPLDPETEARVKANHERFMRSAPVPGQMPTDVLAEQGFKVRTID